MHRSSAVCASGTAHTPFCQAAIVSCQNIHHTMFYLPHVWAAASAVYKSKLVMVWSPDRTVMNEPLFGVALLIGALLYEHPYSSQSPALKGCSPRLNAQSDEGSNSTPSDTHPMLGGSHLSQHSKTTTEQQQVSQHRDSQHQHRLRPTLVSLVSKAAVLRAIRNPLVIPKPLLVPNPQVILPLVALSPLVPHTHPVMNPTQMLDPVCLKLRLFRTVSNTVAVSAVKHLVQAAQDSVHSHVLTSLRHCVVASCAQLPRSLCGQISRPLLCKLWSPYADHM